MGVGRANRSTPFEDSGRATQADSGPTQARLARIIHVGWAKCAELDGGACGNDELAQNNMRLKNDHSHAQAHQIAVSLAHPTNS